MKKTVTILTMVVFAFMTMVMFSNCKDKKHRATDEDDMDDEEEEVMAPADDDEEEGLVIDTVEVHTARDFIQALQSNRCVMVTTDNSLNITGALNDLIEEGRLENFMKNGEERDDNGVFFEVEYDGNKLVVAGLSNLTIAAKGEGYLVVTPRYADVIKFVRCKAVSVRNFTMGHTETGDCVGDVLTFYRCKDVDIHKCHLFGCGVDGLSTSNSELIRVYDTHLYGCSEFGVVLEASSDIRFKRCQIYSNGMGINVDESCSDVNFDDCKFSNNRGQLFMCYGKVTLKNCEIEHHHDDITENVDFINCNVHMDYADAEEYPDIEEE